MTVDKIKIRNLDEEVIKNFRNSSELIGFDSLEESVVKEIKNKAANGNINKYNDRELRNRITLLENNKLNIVDAQDSFLDKENGASKVYVDNKEASIINTINDTIVSKIATVMDNVIKNENGVISEPMLSNDLQDKINLRYENNRKENISSGVNVDDFNKLSIAVNRNTSNIESVQSYVNENVIHIDDKIKLIQLDEDLQNTISNTRLKTISISMADLDNDLQDRLSLGSDDIQEIKNIQNSFNGSTGQTFFALFNKENGKTSLSPKYIMACDAILVKQSALLEEAKIKVLEDTEHDIDYIIDSEANKLYQYNYETSLWAESEKVPHTFIAGRFVKQYKTGDLFFAYNEDEYESVLEISNYLTKTDITPINDEINTIKESVKNIAVNTESITSIQHKITEIEEKITDLTNKIAALEGGTADKQ